MAKTTIGKMLFSSMYVDTIKQAYAKQSTKPSKILPKLELAFHARAKYPSTLSSMIIKMTTPPNTSYLPCNASGISDIASMRLMKVTKFG